jgi:hypothetical protein
MIEPYNLFGRYNHTLIILLEMVSKISSDLILRKIKYTNHIIKFMKSLPWAALLDPYLFLGSFAVELYLSPKLVQ